MHDVSIKLLAVGRDLGRWRMMMMMMCVLIIVALKTEFGA